ncbi:MAG TPA: TonB C-terminal domain-containing protein [Gemmatimonadaceae bacterium]|nr:TonB C-terminal domain-containing protein [Gemmatimonadaceae bacterium]
MIARRADPARLGGPLVLSAVAHAAIVAAMVLAPTPEPPVLPPIYRVTMVAAPPGPRQVGVVREPTPAPPTPAPEPAPAASPKAAELPPDAMAAPEAPRVTPPRQRATPNPTPTPPKARTEPAPTPPKDTKTADAEPAPRTPPRRQPLPTAGGGPEGGRGSDVANVAIRGIEFPYPAYLQNITRQIILRFTPPDGRPLTAEVKFLIHRDGSVSDIQIFRGSGVFDFDLEARAAVEAAGRSGAFGALPAGFPDDVLPVFFTFDPRIIR